MLGLHQIRVDRDLRARAFWYTVMAFPIVVFIPIGGGYAFSGRGAYTQQPFVIINDVFPHSTRAHGWILLLIGIWLFSAEVTMLSGNVAKGFKLAKLGLIVCGSYSTWSFIAFAGATWLNNKYTSSMFWYLGTLIVCGALAILAPPFDRPRVLDHAE